MRLTERLGKAKNVETRQFRVNPKRFLDAVRLHNRAKKASKRAKTSRSAQKQERAFRENPWSFSKSVCCPKPQANPSFTMETGLNRFQSSFEASSGPQYSSLPAWVEEVPHPEITSNFDMSPVTPGLIRNILRKLPNTSAPGPDKIRYLHLKKLPSAHHFLATLYSKIILNSPHAPTLWCKGELRLVHKGGDPGIPANFRSITLTSTIDKLFHRIIA